MSAPFFTILTTTYNRAEIFEETFHSMLKQTFQDFEILVVDDGSTDETPKLLNKLLETHNNVRILFQENKERGAARNLGIKNAKGKYIVMIDSDDIIKENHLQVLYDKILQLGHSDFIGVKFDFIRNGKHFPAPISRLKEGYYDHKSLLHGNLFGIVFAIRRENKGLLFYEEDRRYSILEDWMFNFVNFKNSPIYLIDATTYHIIDHDNRSMRQDNSKIITRKQLAANWILQNVDLSQEEQKTLKGFTAYFCAIHSYLDYKEKIALTYLKKAIQSNGLRWNYISLGIKCLLKRKNIETINSLTGRS
ncbi:MAG: hypothetical protein RLZ10_309 [Bacteroidota bacterium]|jgi:glycosyltransferase involved in cell wall biosynthesis